MNQTLPIYLTVRQLITTNSLRKQALPRVRKHQPLIRQAVGTWKCARRLHIIMNKEDTRKEYIFLRLMLKRRQIEWEHVRGGIHTFGSKIISFFFLNHVFVVVACSHFLTVFIIVPLEGSFTFQGHFCCMIVYSWLLIIIDVSYHGLGSSEGGDLEFSE